MRKLTALVTVVGLMAMALTADAAPTGPADVITTQGSASAFGAPLQDPAITTSADSITVEGSRRYLQNSPAGAVDPKLPTDSPASGAWV